MLTMAGISGITGMHENPGMPGITGKSVMHGMNGSLE